MSQKDQLGQNNHSHSQEEDFNRTIAFDISKLLLSSNLEFIRGVGQTLQAITSLFLTAYIALLVNIANGFSNVTLCIFILLLLPVLLWSGSLVSAFVGSFSHVQSGDEFVLDDLSSTFLTYEKVIKKRRKMLFIPALLSLSGVVAFFVAFFVAIVPVMASTLVK
jgi:hypothetical protein